MKSYIITSIEKDKMNAGIGSSADSFSKCNINEISALQIHLNAAKQTLSQEIIVSDICKSFKDTILSEGKIKSILEFVLSEDSVKRNLKKDRLSKKVKIRYHINNRNDEEEKSLEEILGVDSLTKGKNNALEYAKLENIPEKMLFIITDDLNPDSEKKLVEQKIEYRRELYMKEKFDNSLKCVKFPYLFNYCKNRLFKFLEKNCTKLKNYQEREIMLLSFKDTFLKECLTKDKLWTLLSQFIGISEIECLKLNSDKKELNEISENSELWNKKVFNSNGEMIKKLIKEKFSKIQALPFDELKRLIKINDIEITDEIISKLLDSKFLNKDIMYTFEKEKGVQIKSFTENEILLKDNIKKENLEKIDLTNFNQLKKYKNDLINSILNKKEVKAEDLLNILMKDDRSEQSKQNALIGFKLFKKVLISNGYAVRLLEYLKIPFEKYELSEVNKIENSIEKLLEQRYFNKSAIDIDIEELQSFLKSEGIIKGLKIKVDLINNYEKVNNLNESKIKRAFEFKKNSFVNLLTENIENIVKNKVTEMVSEIDEEKLLTESEVNDKQKQWTFRNTYHWVIRTDSEKNREGLKRSLIEDKKEKEIDKLTSLITQSIIGTIGSIRSSDMFMANYKSIELYFQGTNMPKEVDEYVQLSKNLVFSLTSFQSPWCWKAFCIAIWGVVQLTAGIIITAIPIFGPISLHLGSVLMSEGVSDVLFALQNAGNITWKSYFTNKFWSLLLSITCAGIGAYLSSGANVNFTYILDEIAEQGCGIFIRTVSKTIAGELGKGFMNSMVSFLSSTFASLLTDSIFTNLKEFIISQIQNDSEYKKRKETIAASLLKLEKITSQKATNKILSEKLRETEKDFTDKISNNILGFINTCSGPLSCQISQAASVVEFSGIKVDEKTNKLSNDQAKTLANIAQGITVAVKLMNFAKAIWDLAVIVGQMIFSVDLKIKYKIEIEEKKKQSSEKNVENSSKDDFMKKIDNFIFENISRIVKTSIVTPAFNSVLNHVLKPIYTLLEKTLMKDFNELKRRNLAFGEYKERLNKNDNEEGKTYASVKEFILGELNKLEVFKSPIKELDLKNLPKDGKFEVVINNVKKIIDMSKEEDVKELKKLGSYGFRILPGDPPRISKPNFINYLKSLSVDKPFDEFGLKALADKEKREIIITKSDGSQEVIGEDTGKQPINFFLEKTDENDPGHYMPMVKNSEGKLEKVANLENNGNSCGYETTIYLLERERLLSQNYSPEEADIKAREFLKTPNSRENYIASVVKNAINNPNLQEAYYGRSQEQRTDLEGGAKYRKLK